MVVKGLKRTDRELSSKNLFMAQVCNLWVALPISRVICFTGLLHTALCRTFYANQKQPGSLGLVRLKLCPWKGEHCCINSRRAFVKHLL